MDDQKGHYIPEWISGNKARNAIPDFILLLALCIVLAMSIYLQLIIPQSNWFMRSGAIMVLIGAILEYRNNSLMRSLDTTSIKWAKGVGSPVIFEPHPLRRKISYSAHCLVVLGTFIAAYGDLVFVYIVQLSS